MSKHRRTPHPLAERLLSFFCREHLIEEIIGDLCEYHEELLEKPAWQRPVLYWFHVLQFLRPWALKRPGLFGGVYRYGMFKNYFKITWRSMLGQKVYSAINIGGLSVGFAAFILVFLLVRHEFSYDKFYENSEEIYRVYQRNEGFFYHGTDKYSYTPVGLKPALEEDFPEVIHATTIRDSEALLSVEEENYYEQGIWADPQFFKVFKYPLVLGNPDKVLEKGQSIVLSESLAQKIFGNKNPIGESVIYQNRRPYVVTGILKDLPKTSSIKMSYIASMVSNGQYANDIKDDVWGNNDYHTFFTLAPGADPGAIESKFPALLDSHPTTRRNAKIIRTYLVQPLSDLHLENDINFDLGLKGDSQYIYLLSAVALVVLVLACINYVNLAIARSIKRAQEVGVRKVMGAFKNQIRTQFITESLFIALLALFLALGIVYMLLPQFNLWVERSIEPHLPGDFLLLAVMLGLILSVA